MTNCTDRNHLVDEFTNNDATGGTTTFDAHVEASGTGNCTGSITTAQDGDAVWGGCTSSVQLGSPGTGYTKAADDAAGDFAVFDLPNKPAGSVETILVTQNNGNSFELSAVTIRRQ